MADGSGLLIYGSFTLTCRIRSSHQEITFLVANISEDAIPGMSFFANNQCPLNFDQEMLQIGENSLFCTNKLSNQISTKIQVLNEVQIPTEAELQLTCRLINPRVPLAWWKITAKQTMEQELPLL